MHGYIDEVQRHFIELRLDVLTLPYVPGATVYTTLSLENTPTLRNNSSMAFKLDSKLLGTILETNG